MENEIKELIVKKWYLCKYRPVSLNFNKRESNKDDWEYGMIQNSGPMTKSTWIATFIGPSAYRFNVNTSELNSKNLVIFGDIESFGDIENGIVSRFKKIISELELPSLEDMNAILPKDPMDLEWLNSDIDSADLKNYAEKMRTHLIKYMMYAQNMSKIIDHLNVFNEDMKMVNNANNHVLKYEDEGNSFENPQITGVAGIGRYIITNLKSDSIGLQEQFINDNRPEAVEVQADSSTWVTKGFFLSESEPPV